MSTESKIMTLEMNAIERDFFISSIYKKWEESIDKKKSANAMEFNRKVDGDMQSFLESKKECIESAKKEFEKFDAMLNKFKQFSPLLTGEWYKP